MSARLDQWLQDAATPFEGWDFSHLAGRFTEVEPPWDYLALARAAVGQASDILDVATGGGEIFATLAPFPGRASAVEGFVPNLPVARRRLEPLGVPVFQGSTGSGMPFEDESFDLVLNRHGGFRAAEMWRILKPTSPPPLAPSSPTLTTPWPGCARTSPPSAPRSAAPRPGAALSPSPTSAP